MAATGYEGHMAKRLKTDEHGFHGYGQREKFDDPHKPPPSAVVHVRGLSDAAIEGDLVEAVQHFGGVRDVIMMPRKRQALIEFEDSMCARNCVEYSQTSPINVAGSAAFFNYSTSQKIQRPGDPEDSQQANHILLFTVLNPQYPITVDVMHTICSSYGQVLRIVIFKKNGVQTMVEFDNVDSAKRAKASLNGADVYSGCCTLKIEYAKPTRLNVVRNDSESWDYTQPNLDSETEENKVQVDELKCTSESGNLASCSFETSSIEKESIPSSSSKSSCSKSQIIGAEIETCEITKPLTKTLKIYPKSAPITHSFADFLNVACTTDLLVKTGDDYLIPENCPKLGPPVTNMEVWEHMDPRSQIVDKDIGNIQRQLATGLLPIVKLAEYMEGDKFELETAKKLVSDSITVLCQTQYSLSVKRRHMIRAAIPKKYSKICSMNNTETPITTLLFGDNVAKEMKQREASSQHLKFKHGRGHGKSF